MQQRGRAPPECLALIVDEQCEERLMCLVRQANEIAREEADKRRYVRWDCAEKFSETEEPGVDRIDDRANADETTGPAETAEDCFASCKTPSRL
jgi:hypothetical protein